MRALHIALKDVRIWARDIAALGVLLGMPIVLIFILGSALGGGGEVRIKVAVVNLDVGAVMADPMRPPTSSVGVTTNLGAELVDNFKESEGLNEVFDTSYPADEQAARDGVAAGEYTAMLVVPKDFTERTQDGSPVALQVYTDPGAQLSGSIFEGVVRSLAAQYSAASVAVQTVFTVAEKVDPAVLMTPEGQGRLTQAAIQATTHDGGRLVVVKDGDAEVGNQATPLSYYAVSMTAMFLMFGAMFGAFSTIKERRERTLSRLLSTPTSGGVVVAGKMLGIFVLGMLQFTVLYLATRFFFGVEWGDDVAAIFMIAAAELFAVTGLALLIASLARTERGVGGIAPLVIQIQALVGGAFFAITILPEWLQPIRYVSIVGWAMEGWQTVQIRGGGVTDVLGPTGVLLGFALVFFAVGAALTGARR